MKILIVAFDFAHFSTSQTSHALKSGTKGPGTKISYYPRYHNLKLHVFKVSTQLPTIDLNANPRKISFLQKLSLKT